jgi:hypothetical protein
VFIIPKYKEVSIIMALNPENAANAAKVVNELAAVLKKTGNTASETLQKQPPPVPKRAPLTPPEDTASFSKGISKAGEKTVPMPDPGDKVTVSKQTKFPPPVPKRNLAKQESSSSLPTSSSSPAPMSPRSQATTPAPEVDRPTSPQLPLKGRAAEEAFLAKWQERFPGRPLPAELQKIAERKLKFEQICKEIEALEAQGSQSDRLDDLYFERATFDHTIVVGASTSPRKSILQRVASAVKRSGTPTNGKTSPEPRNPI